MISPYIWWSCAIYTLISAQVVLSGVLYSSEEIRNTSQQNQSDDTKKDSEFTYKVGEDGKTIKYDEIINKEFESPLENNVTKNNDELSLKQNILKIVDDKTIINGDSKKDNLENNNFQKDIILNKRETKSNLLEDNYENLNLSGDSFQITKVNQTTVSINNTSDKLNHDAYNLHDEEESTRTKKINKREFNYDYRNDEYYRKPNHRFGNNFNGPNKNKDYYNENYYKRYDHHVEDDDYNDEQEDDDDYEHDEDNDNDYTGDDEITDDDDFDELFPEEQDDDEEVPDTRRRMHHSKTPLNRQPVNYEQGRKAHQPKKVRNKQGSNNDNESLKMFTFFLDSVINHKLQELAAQIDMSRLMKVNNTSNGYANKYQQLNKYQQKNNTMLINKSNDYSNIEDEMYNSDSVKHDWRSTRNVRDVWGEPTDRNYYEYSNKRNSPQSMNELEENYKRKAMQYQPYIVMHCDDDLSDVKWDKNDQNCPKNDKEQDKKKDDKKQDDKKQDDKKQSNDEEKKTDGKKSEKKRKDSKTSDHKVEKREDTEQEKESGMKKTNKRNTNSTKIHLNDEFDEEDTYNKHYDGVDGDYSTHNSTENVSRNITNKGDRENFNQGLYMKEYTTSRPQLTLTNNKKPEISSIYKLHDIYDHTDKIKEKIEYIPDTVMLYLVDNFLQNIPNRENMNNLEYENHSNDMPNRRASKTKRDLRDISEKKEYEETDTRFINHIILALEKLVLKHLPDYIPGITNELTPHQKDIINKNIINEIFHKIPKQNNEVHTKHGMVSYHHVNPFFENNYSFNDGESQIKREIDNHNYNHDHDQTKPNINIKNVNIFYEGDDRHNNAPNNIKPALSFIEKRYSLPYQSTTFDHKIGKHEFDLLVSNPKTLHTRNLADKLVLPSDSYIKKESNFINKPDEIEDLHHRFESQMNVDNLKNTDKSYDEDYQVTNANNYTSSANSGYDDLKDEFGDNYKHENVDEMSTIYNTEKPLKGSNEKHEEADEFLHEVSHNNTEHDVSKASLNKTSTVQKYNDPKETASETDPHEEFNDEPYETTTYISNMPSHEKNQSETMPIQTKKHVITEDLPSDKQKHLRKYSDDTSTDDSAHHSVYHTMMPLPMIRNQSQPNRTAQEKDLLSNDIDDHNCEEDSVCYLDKAKKINKNYHTTEKETNKIQNNKTSSISLDEATTNIHEEPKKKTNKNKERQDTETIKSQKSQSQKVNEEEDEDLLNYDYDPNQNKKISYDNDGLNGSDVLNQTQVNSREKGSRDQTDKKLKKIPGNKYITYDDDDFDYDDSVDKFGDSRTDFYDEEKASSGELTVNKKAELKKAIVGNSKENDEQNRRKINSQEMKRKGTESKKYEGDKNIKNADNKQSNNEQEINNGSVLKSTTKNGKQVMDEDSLTEQESVKSNKGENKKTSNAKTVYKSEKETDKRKPEKISRANKSDEENGNKFSDLNDNDNNNDDYDQNENDDYNDDEGFHYIINKGTAAYDQIDEDDMVINLGLKRKLTDENDRDDYVNEDDYDSYKDEREEEEEDSKIKTNEYEENDKIEDGNQHDTEKRKTELKSKVTGDKESDDERYKDQHDYDDEEEMTHDERNEDEYDEGIKEETQLQTKKTIKTPEQGDKRINTFSENFDKDDILIENDDEEEEDEEEEKVIKGHKPQKKTNGKSQFREQLKQNSKNTNNQRNEHKEIPEENGTGEEDEAENTEGYKKSQIPKKRNERRYKMDNIEDDEDYIEIDDYSEDPQSKQQKKNKIQVKVIKNSEKQQYDVNEEHNEDDPEDDYAEENIRVQKEDQLETQLKRPEKNAKRSDNKNKKFHDYDTKEYGTDGLVEEDHKQQEEKIKHKKIEKQTKFERGFNKKSNTGEMTDERKYKVKEDDSEDYMVKPKGVEMRELRRGYIEDDNQEDFPHKDIKVKRKSDYLLKEELKKSQDIQKKITKSPNTNQYLMEEKLLNSMENLNHRKRQTSSNRSGSQFNKNDYVRKRDVEKLIEEILESKHESKTKHGMFYKGPKDEYKQMVEDVLESYFQKKNVTAGDDVCIYEEYGSKHGDKDIIYLSGTKLYQNGIPKKDAQNFNLIIRKPHDIDERLEGKMHVKNLGYKDRETDDEYDDIDVNIISKSEKDGRYKKRQVKSTAKRLN